MTTTLERCGESPKITEHVYDSAKPTRTACGEFTVTVLSFTSSHYAVDPERFPTGAAAPCVRCHEAFTDEQVRAF